MTLLRSMKLGEVQQRNVLSMCGAFYALAEKEIARQYETIVRFFCSLQNEQ